MLLTVYPLGRLRSGRICFHIQLQTAVRCCLPVIEAAAATRTPPTSCCDHLGGALPRLGERQLYSIAHDGHERRSIIVISKCKYTTRGKVISEPHRASNLGTKQRGHMREQGEPIAFSRDQRSTPCSRGDIKMEWHVFGIIANLRCVATSWISFSH